MGPFGVPDVHQVVRRHNLPAKRSPSSSAAARRSVSATAASAAAVAPKAETSRLQRRLIETLQRKVVLLEGEVRSRSRSATPVRRTTPTAASASATAAVAAAATPRTRLASRRRRHQRAADADGEEEEQTLGEELAQRHGSLRAAYANLQALYLPRLSLKKCYNLPHDHTLFSDDPEANMPPYVTAASLASFAAFQSAVDAHAGVRLEDASAAAAAAAAADAAEAQLRRLQETRQTLEGLADDRERRHSAQLASLLREVAAEEAEREELEKALAQVVADNPGTRVDPGALQIEEV